MERGQGRAETVPRAQGAQLTWSVPALRAWHSQDVMLIFKYYLS